MNIINAIDRADMLRPNAIPEPEKYAALWKLEAEVAEMMETDLPEWEGEDHELLMPDPYSEMYVACLLPEIDLMQEEMDLYQIDSIAANQKKSEAMAWYRRHNKVKHKDRVRGVWI